MKSILFKMVGRDEKILWKGRPDKKCFILESIFNPMFPVALIWGGIDFLGIICGYNAGGESPPLHILAGFLAFHLFPVWIWLGGALCSWRKYRNTEYIITDKGVYTSCGVFTQTFYMKPFAELSYISIAQGYFDKLCNVGDVVLECDITTFSNTDKILNFPICDIKDFKKVYALIKRLKTKTDSDTMLPNDLQQKENN